MKRFDKYLRKAAKEEEKQTEIPDSVRKCIDMTLAKLPEREKTVHHIRVMPYFAIAVACLLFITLFVMPNISVSYAKTLGKVPVIGDFVRVITLRNYFYSDDNYEMDIDVPKIEDESSEYFELINKDVDEMIKALVNEFYKELEITGNNGYGSIYVDYQVITNDDNWFTLQLLVNEFGASSNTYYKYYHVDKITGRIITLGDLFKNDNFSDVLAEEIRKQMKKQMEESTAAVYWINSSEFAEEFVSVGRNHNFYFNKNGKLVIVFDKYEVGPGSMGCPEFVISKEVIKDILKEKYSRIIS